MKLTNNSGLPEALVKAMQNDSYDSAGSDYTATSLIKPIQIRALEERHAAEIEEEAESGLYRLYGQLAHGLIERANMADLAEKRFFMEVAGKKISAQIDTLSLKDGVLTDFKFTTAWGFHKGKPPKQDWIVQMNIQLELLRQNGLDASKLQIIGLLRDWQIRDSKEKSEYPQRPVAVMEIPVWAREQTIAYITMRVAEHEKAKFTPSEMLPECSFEERFAGKQSWAVVKNGKGGKSRAIPGGVQFSEEAAQKICESNPGTRIEYRREDPTKRCLYYCNVSQFCHQFKRLTAIKQAGAEEVKDEVS